MNKEGICVILPVFNGGSFLKESVESVLKQSFYPFEFLILDDCSNDESWAYLSSIKDERITLFKNETNKGLFYNLNYLIGRSTSPLIKLWSQDDIMYPGCLQAFLAFHGRHQHIGFSYCGRDIIDEYGIIKPNEHIDTTPDIVSPELHALIAYYTGSIAGNIANVCVNRKALERVGLFKERMKISADFDMWVRLARYYDTGFIREKLIQLRDHSGQLSRKESWYINHVEEDMEVYKYLNSYVSPGIRNEGKKLLRNHKLVFYYTLFIKSLVRGHFATAVSYTRLLSKFDNIFQITFSFIKAKLSKPVTPSF